MTEQEINRAVQYVTASTSYGRDTVADILKTGLGELADLAMQSTRHFDREALLEYISQWTIKRTGQLSRWSAKCWAVQVAGWTKSVKKFPSSSPRRWSLTSHDDEGAEPA